MQYVTKQGVNTGRCPARSGEKVERFFLTRYPGKRHTRQPQNRHTLPRSQQRARRLRGLYFFPPEGVTRNLDRASPRFWMNASELYTSAAERAPAGAIGSTSSNWNSRATSSTIFGPIGRCWSTNPLTSECSHRRFTTRGTPSEYKCTVSIAGLLKIGVELAPAMRS